MHFYHVQPSELRRLAMGDIAALIRWRDDYLRTEAEEMRSLNAR